MKAAPKTPKAKRQEEQANFISWRFALLCGCILLALAFLLGRVARLQVISPDMLVRGAICVLCAYRKCPPRAG